MNVENSYSVVFQNDATCSYMVFKLRPEVYLIDYQVKMIKENPSPNLLALHRKQFDNEVCLFYDITSKISMEQLLGRRKLSRYELLTIIRSLAKGLQTGKRYLLHGGHYILDFKHIYINPSSLDAALAYVPVNVESDVKEELRAFLIDLIVYKAVFVNPEEGGFVYKLLSLLKSDAFSLEQLDRMAYEIAMEGEESKTDTINKPQGKESLNVQGIVSQSEKKDPRDSLKGRLYIAALLQLLFISVLLLMLRMLQMQNQGIDIYNAAGAVLLILSADFFAVKKLRILDRHKIQRVKVEGVITKPKVCRDVVEKNLSIDRKQVHNPLPVSNFKASSFIDPETTVLSEQEPSCAYLVNCSEGTNEKIILSKDSFIIGRLKNQVDFISRNNAVGKVHAEIICREGMHYLKDLNSRNGTYINGERIVSNVEYVIESNDRVAFANSEYKFLQTAGANQ